MKTLADTADHRSRLFQLLALGFTHPIEAFHRILVDGSYRQALVSAGLCADAIAIEQCGDAADLTTFEADHIHLFQVGRRGRPLVSLNAADHKEISQQRGHPEVLLEYSSWYRHFGLRTSDAGGANELPDHLVCQLEFLAWLAHLEASTSEAAGLRLGYQRAQRDFLQRHLQDFLETLVARLQQLRKPLASLPYYRSLAALSLQATDQILGQLEAELAVSEPSDKGVESSEIPAVNLWG